MNAEQTEFMNIMMNFSMILRMNEFGGPINSNEIIALFDRLGELLLLIDDVFIQEYIEHHYDEMSIVKKKLYSFKPFRHYIDSLFTNKMKFRKKPGMYVTKIFGEFIRGVTYFNTETLNDFFPIYHRLASCGPPEQTLSCKNKQKKSEKKKIRKCYIERLIYNDIFIHNTLNFPKTTEFVEHSQDEGHIEAINRIKTKFEECFPKRNIIVEMNYLNEYPTELQIIETYNNTVISIEKYNRRLNGDKKYDYTVDAIKMKDGVMYERKQNFAHIFQWKVVPNLYDVDRFLYETFI